MANEEHLKILEQGVEVWNQWREENLDMRPDLNEAYLSGVDLSGADLRMTDLVRADLREADLSKGGLHRANLYRADLQRAKLNLASITGGVNLTRANLSGADLRRAFLRGAVLSQAHLNEADLRLTNLSMSVLRGADLRMADLNSAHVYNTDLSGANFKRAMVGFTTFGNIDLSEVKGLEAVEHSGPSFIDFHTVYLSQGKIPEAFLRGAGIPDTFIDYIASLTGEAIQYYSCFISYSHDDEAFAQCLHNDLQGKGVRCWYAPEHMKGGRKLYPQIDEAIRAHDKLLLVLSENSIHSQWVMTEIRRARKAEARDGRRKLFPVRLVDWETIKAWECFDADAGKDLAVEVREYFIPDFSHWKDHDAYQQGFDRLLRDLKAEEG